MNNVEEHIDSTTNTTQVSLSTKEKQLFETYKLTFEAADILCDMRETNVSYSGIVDVMNAVRFYCALGLSVLFVLSITSMLQKNYDTFTACIIFMMALVMHAVLKVRSFEKQIRINTDKFNVLNAQAQEMHNKYKELYEVI